MHTLDDFFTPTADPSHPRLRDWAKRLAGANTTATLEVFQPRGEFGPAKPEMHMQFAIAGKQTQLDAVPWDDDLNAGLIRLKVRSVSSDNEALRFALGLFAAMRRAEREFGDGYFNAVLVEFIRESDLTQHQVITDVLDHVYATTPHREGGPFGRYNICRESIASAIGGRAKELTEALGYTQNLAKEILVLALARYLDDRFSVSDRRKSGLL